MTFILQFDAHPGGVSTATREAGLPAGQRHPLSHSRQRTAGQPLQLGPGSADAGLCRVPGWGSSQHHRHVPASQPPRGRARGGEQGAPGSQTPGPARAGRLHTAGPCAAAEACVTAPKALAHRGHPSPHHRREPGTVSISFSVHLRSGPWPRCPSEGHTQGAVTWSDWVCSLQVTNGLLLSPGSQPLTPCWRPAANANTEAGRALLLAQVYTVHSGTFAHFSGKAVEGKGRPPLPSLSQHTLAHLLRERGSLARTVGS